jgi:periplasmic protein TonB
VVHSLARRLSRGMPWLASSAIHLVLLGAVLALAARAVTRLPAFIQAELVTLESPAPVPRERFQPRIIPPAPRVKIPTPAKAPTRLPRLIEPRLPNLAALLEIENPPAPVPENAREMPTPAPESTKQDAPKPDRAPETRMDHAIEPRPGAQGPRGASGTESRPGPPFVAAAPTGPGERPAGSGVETGVSLFAGAGPGTADSGRGAGGSQAVASTGSGGGVTRTAIPRGGYQVQPRYPTSARRLGIQGTTLLRVFVAVDGRVTEVSVERTAGHADLDEAAADAVRRWRFEPAISGDTPVAMWVLLPVEFRLK